MQDAPRNLVLILLDALRADRVGCLGSEKSLTPTIDSLAEEGHVFENAFACANATDPSVTSIHTGRDPSTTVFHHGQYVTDQEKRRAESARTFSELLRESGFRTVAAGRALGRWHRKGFESYPEPILSTHTERRIGEQIGRISPRLSSILGTIYHGLNRTGHRCSSRAEVVSLFERLGDGRFYGFLHLMDTHAPYDPDPALVEDLLERYDYPADDLSTFLEEHSDRPYVSEFLEDMATPRDFEVGIGRFIARYDACVVEADLAVREVLDRLEAEGRRSETAVVVPSDHGESLLEHNIYFDHHGLYDESVRVPLVIDLPGDDCGRHEEVVQLKDLAPTALDLLACEQTLDCTGRSLLPLIEGSGDWDTRDSIFLSEAQAQRRVGVRKGKYKFIAHVEDPVLERERGSSLRCGYCATVHGDERELYDCRSDPGELEDISRANSLLGWEPTVDIETGLRNVISYLREEETLED